MTTIEWTDETWNPITGCTKISEGCKNCYAETIARRFWGDRKFSDVQFHPERLKTPGKWKMPRMVFVCSMSDLFHPGVNPEWQIRILNCIGNNPQHTFQVLTKRPKRAKFVIDTYYEYVRFTKPMENLWLGVSVENQKAADERIPILLDTPAAVRFVSCEPLLEDVNLRLSGWISRNKRYLPGLDWVIVGGESGPKARVMKPEWARSLLRQCREADIPFFFKQMGSKWMNGKGKGNNLEDIPEDLRVREFPK